MIEAELHDGTVLEFPDGTAPDVVQRVVKKHLGVAPTETVKPTTTAQDIKQGAGNLIAGAFRGAGSIGATLLSPIDAAARALNGGQPVNIGGYDIAGQDRRAGMDGGLQEMGAQPDSLLYKTGKIGAEIAGTAGAGGAAANAISKVAPSAAAVMPGLFQALRTGGMSAGGAGIGTRVAGGALNGGLTAGMVNPDDALMGAGIGGAIPGGMKLAQASGELLKRGSAATVKGILGATTGVGGEAIGTAYQAGKSGGTSFLDNLRGNVPMTDVLDQAKSALTNMRLDRSNQYKQGMAGVSADKSVIDFAPIDQAVNALRSTGSYKGQVINKNAAGTVDEISSLVDQWKHLDPTEFHTPEGLDALKQALGDVRDATQFGTSGRKAADTAYNAVKNEITAQAPTYSKVMGDYSQASDTLKEVERALSLDKKASADTSMRKLQSLMRNNVNTNYGNRLGLAKELENNGAEILPAVAGQALSSITPRGLATVGASGGAVASLLTNPYALAGLPLASPRAVGEAAYGLGALTRGASGATSAASQKMAELLRSAGVPKLSMDQIAPLLATGGVLAASQR